MTKPTSKRYSPEVNNRRLLDPIGNIPPAEAEADYYPQLEAIPAAALDANKIVFGKPGAIQSGLGPIP